MSASRLSWSLLFAVLILPSVSGQERVSLRAADGFSLAGTYFPPEGQPRGGVLLLHMYKGNRSVWAPLTARLAARGFHVLALDLRGHGESTLDPEGKHLDIERSVAKDPATNPFLRMHLDAEAGCAFLRSRGAPEGRMAIVGASVGCSVALHAAVENPKAVAALVLMTPGVDYLGVPSLEHARRYGERPVLILSAEEEAILGARPLKEVLTSAKAELRLLPQGAIHGTRMFGRVPAIEADIIQWLEQALATSLQLTIPLSRTVIVDGQVDSQEAPEATRLTVPLEGEQTAEIRLCRNRTKILCGLVVPERYLRHNEVVVYLDGSGEGPPAPTASCWRISYNPANPRRRPLEVARGENGTWKESEDEGVQAYARTNEPSQWTAEISLSLARFVGRPLPCTVRIAFQINGQKEGQEWFYPPTANLKTSPRIWVQAQL